MMENVFKTSDLGLASYLHSIGAKLVEVDRADPQRAVFVFERDPSQDQAAKSWQAGTAVVNALAFWNSSRVLKRKLFRNGDGDGKSTS